MSTKVNEVLGQQSRGQGDAGEERLAGRFLADGGAAGADARRAAGAGRACGHGDALGKRAFLQSYTSQKGRQDIAEPPLTD